MSFSVTGKVIEVGPVEQVTDSFKKRICVVEFAPNPQYPDEIKFETVQDRVSMLDNIYPGDEVEVSFNIRGRKYTSKAGVTDWFNTLQPWRINKTGQAASTPPPTSGMTREAYNANPANQPAQGPTVEVQAPSFDDGEDDGLPFS